MEKKFHSIPNLNQKGGGKRTKTSKQKTTKRKKSSKPNKQRSRSTRSVAKKKKSSPRRKSSKSFIDRIPILNNPTVQKIGFGLGMGAIAVQLIDLVPIPQVQQNKRLIQLAVEAATEPLSAVADIALNSGVLKNVASQFGGGGSSNGNGMNSGQDMVGFA